MNEQGESIRQWALIKTSQSMALLATFNLQVHKPCQGSRYKAGYRLVGDDATPSTISVHESEALLCASCWTTVTMTRIRMSNLESVGSCFLRRFQQKGGHVRVGFIQLYVRTSNKV